MYAGVPNCKFGIDKRSKDWKEMSPGPGRYDELRNIGASGPPKYSMPGRRAGHVTIDR